MGPLGSPELVIYPPLFLCWDRGLPYGLGLVPGRAGQGGGVVVSCWGGCLAPTCFLTLQGLWLLPTGQLEKGHCMFCHTLVLGWLACEFTPCQPP